ncbi:hypothetical protein PMAYCL1PPCAC_01531, partial [Pristionchus mayeri]
LKIQLAKHQFTHKENIHQTLDLGERLKGVLAKPTIVKAIVNREKIEATYKPSKVEWIWSKQYFKCTLCGDKKFPTTVSPIGPIRARKFFDNVVTLTEKERERIQFVINNKIRADVCQKHFILSHYSGNAQRTPEEKRSRTELNPTVFSEDDKANEEPFDEPGPSGSR